MLVLGLLIVANQAMVPLIINLSLKTYLSHYIIQMNFLLLHSNLSSGEYCSSQPVIITLINSFQSDFGCWKDEERCVWYKY